MNKKKERIGNITIIETFNNKPFYQEKTKTKKKSPKRESSSPAIQYTL